MDILIAEATLVTKATLVDEAIPITEATPSVATPVAEATLSAEATPSAEVTPSAEATPVAETTLAIEDTPNITGIGVANIFQSVWFFIGICFTICARRTGNLLTVSVEIPKKVLYYPFPPLLNTVVRDLGLISGYENVCFRSKKGTFHSYVCKVVDYESFAIYITKPIIPILEKSVEETRKKRAERKEPKRAMMSIARREFNDYRNGSFIVKYKTKEEDDYDMFPENSYLLDIIVGALIFAQQSEK
jgi:hypothetical protein